MDDKALERERPIVTDSNKEITESSDASSDWQSRRNETERLKEELKKHFESVADRSEQAKRYFRPAKPAPAIDDGTTKKVAAYTRVSTNSLEQVSSIENQTLYYTKKITSTPNWKLQKIYSDEGKSGTSMRHRDQFKQMLRDAKDKKMDMIICASVSRFARNVQDCLEQVSELKTMNPSHPVGVYFETENIYTLNPDSDQSLGVHALLADWESANKSRRMILSYDQRILTGQYPACDLLGYRHTKDGKLVIVPEEAKTVKFVYLAYILGYSYEEIASVLTEKRRSTLHGRQEWNSSMVAAIMNNERRWGALEARKWIVVDYKKGKTTRNRNDRCSAFVPDHHTGIVSPEMANAIECVRKSSNYRSTGFSEIAVIPTGMLKGFVSVVPSWGGVSNSVYHLISRSVYAEDELQEINRYLDLVKSRQHSKVIDKELSGYEVPYGVGYLTKSMPSLTISRRSLLLNSSCHKKLDGTQYVEILYHPIQQMIVVRESSNGVATSTKWVDDAGIPITKMASREFSEAVYENMCWKKEYSYRFRGITKERNGNRIMIFYLDEPQIMLSAKQKQRLISDGYSFNSSTAYIPYHENPEDDNESVFVSVSH